MLSYKNNYFSKLVSLLQKYIVPKAVLNMKKENPHRVLRAVSGMWQMLNKWSALLLRIFAKPSAEIPFRMLGSKVVHVI
jgi:hypothetical protein